jgi:RNA polymerase sigma-70 factor (ECF subfamily)
VSGDAAAAVAEAFHEEWGRVVATLIGMTGDWDLAEECAQEAFAQALDSWPGDGVPRRPGAWLTTVARNRALDRLRRRTNEKTKLEQAALLSRAAEGDDYVYDDSGVPDDRLRLMFTCCHPALSLEAQVALTLRTLAGLTTAEVARAFLVEEATMAKRLVRAKGKIRNAGIPYRVPPAHLLPQRTAGVLAVVYLLFNEGYVASAGAPLMRSDLAAESIRLARLLVALMPEEAEAGGLLALLLLQDSRRDARVDAAGELVTLEDQDRSLWDPGAIDEGRRHLEAASALGRPGPYQIQALIAACHSTAADAADTDWARIARLYAQLGQLTPSPVVELNRAVAVAMSEGPEAGLVLVDDLSATGPLEGYYLLAATRADLLRRAGRASEAAQSYREALELVSTDAERRHLTRRLHETADQASRSGQW